MRYKDLRRMEPVERRRITEHLLALRQQLAEEIPTRTRTDTLLLATWNVRALSNERRDENIYYIAEIIDHFDLVAVQEVKDEEVLERILKLLGKKWDYLVTDVTEGNLGNGERLAFMYNTEKVSFLHQAGEVVLSEDNGAEIADGTRQFARTPYCVAFTAGYFNFKITTVHIFYGDANSKADRAHRAAEIRTIANKLGQRAVKEDVTYIILGDFNITNSKSEYMAALENSEGGFKIPEEIKNHPTNYGKQAMYYDQIAFNVRLDDDMVLFTPGKQHSGAFDFTKSIYRDDEAELYKPFMKKEHQKKTGDALDKYFKEKYRTFEISDHQPLWVELKIDFSDEYLKSHI